MQHRKGRENANADALPRLPEDPRFLLPKGGRNVRDLKGARERNAELADHFGQSKIDQSHPASKGSFQKRSIHSGPITSAVIDQSHPASMDALVIDPQPGL